MQRAISARPEAAARHQPAESGEFEWDTAANGWVEKVCFRGIVQRFLRVVPAGPGQRQYTRQEEQDVQAQIPAACARAEEAVEHIAAHMAFLDRV